MFFKKHLVVNYVYYLLGIIIPGLMSFLFIPFVTRNYGAEIYARYSIAFNTMSVVSMFCYSWVAQSYIRLYSKEEPGLDKAASKYLWLSLVIGLVIFVFCIFLTTDIEVTYISFLVPSFILSGYYYFFLFACQAQQKAKLVAVSEAVRTGTILLLPLFCSYFLKKEYALYILLISLFLSYLIPIVIFLSKTVGNTSLFLFNRIPGNLLPLMGKQIKTYGIPVAFFLSLSLALAVNDRFLMAQLLDYKTSGNYAAIYDVLNKGVTFICSPVIMTFHPHIIREYNFGNKKGAYASIIKALMLEVLIFITGFFALCFFSVFLLHFIYENEVPNGFRELVFILYIGVFVWQFAMLIHKPLELRMRTKWMAVGAFIAFLLNFLCNYFLLKQYQNALIAAYTTLGASLFYFVYVLFFSLRNRSLKFADVS